MHSDDLHKLIEKAKKLALTSVFNEESLNTNLEILKLDPQNISSMNRLAKIYSILGQENKAIDMYKKVIMLDPNNNIAINSLERNWKIRYDPISKDYITKKASFNFNHKLNNMVPDFYEKSCDENLPNFIIFRNQYLSKECKGYYHQDYYGHNQPDNPEFLLEFKNTFNKMRITSESEPFKKVSVIVAESIPIIMKKSGFKECICVVVPRAKSYSTYSKDQMMFSEAIRHGIKGISGVSDGINVITRVKDTLTTHLKNRNISIPNEGPEPYPGITRDTCTIDFIKDHNVILIDDIYTKNVNIDEDCIQAMYECGAKEVVFFSIGFTRSTR